jgi:hypothetical protein
MRVFYVEEDEVRPYYVKLDNVDVPDDLKGFKRMYATSSLDLIKEIKLLFKLKKDHIIQLWSNSNYTGKRLDILDNIPLEYEFIYARVIECCEI